ncbi:hypothetical protein HAHI6034_01180 [Hathewaya histolytica]|uniref:Uncharacterized protein n=1 Tax=Hathewaya histolytica TaxID=1498 RepID=A0A4U9QXS0_HATHI|nr:hypothetical protein [Hathewaya histolytica]VTQ83654.1 Uncharacterised protein [Hathewaya histolytica]
MMNFKKVLLIICIIVNTFILLLFLKDKKYSYIAIVLYNYYICISGLRFLKDKK